MEQQLFNDETIITRTDRDEIILTSHRIRYQPSKSNMMSFMLDNVTSIEFKYYSWPVLLAVSVMFLIGAGVALNDGDEDIVLYLIIGAAIFGLLYFSSRRHVIKIASPSGAFQFVVKGMGRDKVLDFVNKIEQARKELLKF